ncbi:MAG TPA: cysteine hydrolase family protein [Caulobacteraceae bacterium]
MRQALLAVDVQSGFGPPDWLVTGISRLLPLMPSCATVELHDEAVVPFQAQLGWRPEAEDTNLVPADHIFIKHGYGLPPDLVAHLKQLRAGRVLVCGIQADTCVLAAGFALFDAGLFPTMIVDLVVGSSLDRSGRLGANLWRHHFGAVIESRELLDQQIRNST